MTMRLLRFELDKWSCQLSLLAMSQSSSRLIEWFTNLCLVRTVFIAVAALAKPELFTWFDGP